MKISVVGTGYVGLVSGVCLASKGHEVTCIDVIQEKVDRINAGDPPIYEEGLESLLKEHVGTRIQATTDFTGAVMDSELSLIAVGTPFDGERIDLKYIKQVAQQLGEVLRDKPTYHTVIVKSTVVPGTTEDVVLPILEAASGKKAGTDFGVGMNPEFLKEGEAIKDFMEPDRIVLGGIDARTIAVLDEVYSVFPDTDKLRTSPRTAEMIKYTANSLLATLISFSNEIGNLCAALENVDTVEVMQGVHLDKRFAPILESGQRVFPSSLTYLASGCGFGGSCFPKDVKALIRYGQDRGQSMSILDSVIQTNLAQPQRMVELALKHFASLAGVRVAVLGLAFKPGTDDIRESASIAVIRDLLAHQADIIAFDPIAQEETEKALGEGTIAYAETVEACVEGAEVILLMTSWPQFKSLPELIAAMPMTPLLVDGRRMIARSSVPRYEGIGFTLPVPESATA
ncbi:UDP-glucose dehydrogenase family protein [Coraliomargarita parva]|uniref:UDP-glucose dehydrogenase family protein n=1 Tax=Coraliomargarita parva TaxID=3014050 RepID=UPI0022B50860|nr:UDP-glucose/GDP-mannose dehydrogenase family protein [Coraliomargarita parva]